MKFDGFTKIMVKPKPAHIAWPNHLLKNKV